MMSDCLEAFQCDLEDESSLALLRAKIAKHPHQSRFRIDLENLPFWLRLEKKETGVLKADIMRDALRMGDIGQGFCYSKDNWHRDLEIYESCGDMSRGTVAHFALKCMRAIEGTIQPNENVSGYDLVLFYIREGYVPESRTSAFETLKEELVEFMISGTKLGEERYDLPTVRLKYEPEAAVIYWEELKEKAGYSETGDRN